ncbi:MAG: BC1881 family protein [Acutalibacter sp.]|nr:BC1881 family protein [Acutalibacter sp.]
MDELEKIPTCALVSELKTREGVELTIAEPYQDVHITVNGPAVVLTIID